MLLGFRDHMGISRMMREDFAEGFGPLDVQIQASGVVDGGLEVGVD